MGMFPVLMLIQERKKRLHIDVDVEIEQAN